MKLEKKQIILYKNKVGQVLQYYEDSNCTKLEPFFRFASIDNKPSWQKAKELFPIIKPSQARKPSENQIDKWLMSENRWLGKPIKVHRIGDYQIVEYYERETKTRRLTKNKLYSCYMNLESLSVSCGGLDSAIAHCIAYKYDGSGTKADLYFMRAIGGKE